MRFINRSLYNSCRPVYRHSNHVFLRVCFPFLLVVTAFSPIWSSSVTVEYSEGRLEVEEETGRRRVRVGDEIDANSRILVGEDSAAVLSTSSVRLSLTAPGTYLVKDLLETVTTLSRVGFGQIIVRRLEGLLSGKPLDTAGTMGVRGDRVGEGAQWLGDETVIELMELGKKLLREGECDEAIELLEEALEYVDREDAGEILFYLGTGYAMRDEIIPALKHLSQAEPDPDSEFYPDLVTLRATLLVKSFSYSAALEWLRSNPVDPARRESAQIVELLNGLSYLMLQDHERGMAHLLKAHEIDSDSEAGRMTIEIAEALDETR